MESAGVYTDWPAGRGTYTSFDRSLIIWLNECDHVRLMYRKEVGADFVKAYRTFAKVARRMDGLGRFDRDTRLGYLPFDIAGVGTGLRASVRLVLKAVGEPQLAAACNEADLGFRKVRDELDLPGIYDVFNRRTFGVTETDIVAGVVAGVNKIIDMEKKKK